MFCITTQVLIPKPPLQLHLPLTYHQALSSRIYLKNLFHTQSQKGKKKKKKTLWQNNEIFHRVTLLGP
jgi:hypothetical protein